MESYPIYFFVCGWFLLINIVCKINQYCCIYLWSFQSHCCIPLCEYTILDPVYRWWTGGRFLLLSIPNGAATNLFCWICIHCYWLCILCIILYIFYICRVWWIIFHHIWLNWWSCGWILLCILSGDFLFYVVTFMIGQGIILNILHTWKNLDIFW